MQPELLQTQPPESGGATAGADTYEALLKEVCVTVEKATTLLKTIVNPKTGEAALPEIKLAAARWANLAEATAISAPQSIDQQIKMRKYSAVWDKWHMIFVVWKDEFDRVKAMPGGDKFIKPFCEAFPGLR